jgi:hypothetical protein
MTFTSFIGLMSLRGQPVIQPHRVRAGREGLRECVFAGLGGHQLLQAGAIGHALILELVGERDRLAIVVQRHQHGHVLLRASDTQMHAIDKAIEHVSRIELAIHQLVAHGCPGGFLARDDLDAVLLVELVHRCHDDRRTVGQRDEADADFLLLRRVRAGGKNTASGQRAHECGTRAECGALPEKAAAREISRHRLRIEQLVIHVLLQCID